MEQRKIGRSGISVSPLGLGTWGIGGEFFLDGKPDGWGQIDDNESIKALREAVDLGVNYIDTADAYGVGHSEKVIGEAFSGIRDKVVISTKFGYFGNESTRTLNGINITPNYIRRACDASLKRLKTDYIDLYFIHVWELGISDLNSVCDTLDSLTSEGKIRTYGWSTDLIDGARIIARRKNCSAIQQKLSVLEGDTGLLRLCEEENLASVNRSPLAMGILSGKFRADTKMPANDVRGSSFDWLEGLFKDGRPAPDAINRYEAVGEILKSGGRTAAQGALAWIWAKSGSTVPIPGFKSVKQVRENAGAVGFGPLTENQMDEIERLLQQ